MRGRPQDVKSSPPVISNAALRAARRAKPGAVLSVVAHLDQPHPLRFLLLILSFCARPSALLLLRKLTYTLGV